uniref:THAP-type domain-containing protein n=1 Tax=Jaculus jaculus TaxID=51337 RepID=A0A8C5JU12_JACJA
MPRPCSAPAAAHGPRAGRATAASPSTDFPKKTARDAACGWPTVSGWPEYIDLCSKHFEENCFELVGVSGYHRLKEGAVPTIFESFSKLHRTTKIKGHDYICRRCKKRCSQGRGPTTPFSLPPPVDVTCFPVEEASAPAALPASPAGRLEPGLSNSFSDLLSPLGAQADEAGCSAQPSPERQPSSLEPRPVSPSAYMLRLPPPAGAYIQNEHSYLRAEAALDALDKAQRQLRACKRRGQRLRLRLTKLQQKRAREKRAQADARQTLKEHVQDFAMQLSSSMAREEAHPTRLWPLPQNLPGEEPAPTRLPDVIIKGIQEKPCFLPGSGLGMPHRFNLQTVSKAPNGLRRWYLSSWLQGSESLSEPLPVHLFHSPQESVKTQDGMSWGQT